MSLVPVVTIDGPSGSGKGTLARRAAERYGYHLLDSGALYRIVAVEARRKGIDLSDEIAVAAVARAMQVDFSLASREGVAVLLNGEDVSLQVRTETCGMQASQIAPMPALRAALLDVQRDFRRQPGLVADGRDMGTVVFPDAQVKIFLTASAESRAQRRHKQLKENGIDTKIATLLREIQARDERDKNRRSSPLRSACDAHVIDSTAMSIAEVEDEIVRLVEAKVLAQSFKP